MLKSPLSRKLTANRLVIQVKNLIYLRKLNIYENEIL